MLTVDFRGHTWPVAFSRYHEPANEAIILGDLDTPDHLVASVNPAYLLDDGYVGIKDWSENEGILAALADSGIVSGPESWIPSGFVEIAVCRILKQE